MLSFKSNRQGTIEIPEIYWKDFVETKELQHEYDRLNK